MHEVVNHTQKAYARGEVHEHRAACLCSFLKPYLRVVQGVSKRNFTGYGGFFPFLRNTRHWNACAQAEMIVPPHETQPSPRAPRGENMSTIGIISVFYKRREIARMRLATALSCLPQGAR
jgi:hypothetical protein